MKGFWTLSVGALLFTSAVFAADAQATTTVPARAESPATAKSTDEYKDEIALKKGEILVGINVIRLEKLDVATGSFTAEFFLSVKSREPIPDDTFEFMNGRASSIDKQVDAKPDDTDQKDRPADARCFEKFYRIVANLSTPMDMKRFPFDAQKMQIILEPRNKELSELRCVPFMKESDVDKAIFFPGWRITGFDSKAVTHDYPIYKSTYSQLVFTVHIERMKMNAFMKTFMPVLFLMLIVMATFILNPEQLATRLAAIGSTLVASAMFHLSISGQIPPVGYLTFADKFMVLTYFILLACFFLSLYVFVLQGKKEEERAHRLNRLTERIVLVGMPVIYAALFLFFR